MKKSLIAFFISLLLLPVLASAGAVITYHGRILDNNNQPVESNSVTFKIRIYSPNPGKCLLYEEVRTISMVGSGGVFVIPIGDGVGSRTGVDPGINMERIFSNDTTLTFNTTNTPLLVCNTGVSYSPGVLDQRQLYVSFDDHSGVGENELPLMDLGYVPFAVSAYDSQNIGGTPAASVLRVQGGSATALTPANFAELLNVIDGTSTQYIKSGQETDPSVKTFAKTDLPVCGVNQVLKASGGVLSCVSGGSTVTPATTSATGVVQVGSGLVVDVAGLLTTDNAAIQAALALGISNITGLQTALDDRILYSQMPSCTAGEVWTFISPVGGFTCTSISITAAKVSDFSSAVDARIAADATKLPLNGGTMSGAIDMNGNNLTLTGFITMNPSKSLHLSNNAADPAGLLLADKGKVWFNSSTNEIKYWDGSQAKALGAAGAGGTVTSVASANADIGVATSTSTPVLTLNSGTGANQIVKLDATSKLPAVDGSELISLNASNLASGTVPTTVLPIIPLTKGGTGLSAAGTANQVLGMNNAGTAAEFKTITAGSGVSVTHGVNSVTIATTGAAPTGSAGGDLSGTYPNPTINTVTVDKGGTGLTAGTSGGIPYFASTSTMASTGAGAAYQPLRIPSGGGAPAFGAIDISQSATVTGILPITNGGTGASSLAGNRLIGTNGTGSAQQEVTCALNQILSFDASGNYGCYSPGSIFSGFINGGNSFGAASSLGNNDNFALNIKTNNLTRMTVLAGGNVGIGAANPTYLLSLNGDALRTFGMERMSTAGTQGMGFNITAGGGYAGASNVHGGDLTLSSGISTGAGSSNILFNTATAGSVGTPDRVPSTKMTILGSGNVGIGVASPTANLHVAGISILGRSPSSYTGTSASAVLGNSTNSPNIVFEAPTFATLGWNNGIFSFGTCSNSTCSGGSPYFSIDTTTNMATFSNTNAVRAGNGNGNPAAPTYSFSTSTASGMYSPAANNLSFATTSNERMRIDASGNVGIGTASPSFTLDVQSSASFQGRFLHSSNNQYDGSAIMMTRTRGTLASNTAVTSGDTIGGMYFRAHDGSGTGTTNSSVEVSAGENHSGTNRGTYMIFETTTNGSAARSEKMRIHSNGFVGIGTTAPAGRLHVQQSANDENNGVLLSNTGGTGNTAIFVDSSNRTHFGGKTASPNAIVIDNSSGNVGIGITAPGVSLDVVSAVATPLRLRNSGYPGTYWQVGPESTSNAFVIYNTGGTGMYITSGSTTWTANSDRRIKRDIELIPKSLTKLNQINGVTYWYKTDAENEPRRVGVIAQDVQKVLPEAVSEKDGILGVRYQELIPLVINALKELYAEFKTQSSEQNRKIASLEEENLRLKAEIQDTKKAVCEINPQAKICK